MTMSVSDREENISGKESMQCFQKPSLSGLLKVEVVWYG